MELDNHIQGAQRHRGAHAQHYRGAVHGGVVGGEGARSARGAYTLLHAEMGCSASIAVVGLPPGPPDMERPAPNSRRALQVDGVIWADVPWYPQDNGQHLLCRSSDGWTGHHPPQRQAASNHNQTEQI